MIVYEVYPEMVYKANDCIWNREKIFRLIEVLSKVYTIDIDKFIIGIVSRYREGGHGVNYFEFLVAIILSQNTNDKNAIKAFKNLKAVIGDITPEKIIEMDSKKVEEIIRVAGLASRRSRVLKELAYILSRNPHFFDELKDLDVEEARKRLLNLPGIGFKSADVFLLMVLKKPTFPIDTHINRIVRRLGIASAKEKYEDIRAKILSYLSSDIEKLTLLHLLLITHGRSTCSAKKPLCSYCVIADMCCGML